MQPTSLRVAQAPPAEGQAVQDAPLFDCLRWLDANKAEIKRE